MTGSSAPTPAAVCFDVGEVLIDETRVWSVWAHLLGVSPFTLHARIGAALAAGRPFGAALEEVAGPGWRDLEAVHEAAYGGFREEDLYVDVRPALARLAAAGITVAIVGNQPARRSEQLLALDLGAHVIATSEELGVDKPDPRFFARVLERLDVLDPSRVVYVGDRRDNDIVPAAAAGWRTVWIRRGPWAALQPDPGGAVADLVVDGLEDLADRLVGHAPR